MKQNRPLSPHLTIYKPLRPAIFSILNRISGAVLSLSIIFFVFFIQNCYVTLTTDWKIYYICFQTISFISINKIDLFFYFCFWIALLYHFIHAIFFAYLDSKH